MRKLAPAALVLKDVALGALERQPTREDIRRVALRVLENPPTTDVEIWARVFRAVARAHATFDLETAVLVQAQAQRMQPTPEGERTLARMRAELRGEPTTPTSPADEASRRRELEEMRRGSRRRSPRGSALHSIK